MTTDPNSIFDGSPAFPFAEVEKSATPTGSELMARTGLRSNETKGPGRTGRPRKHKPKPLTHPDDPALTDAEYDSLVSYLASREAVTVIECDDDIHADGFQVGPTFHHSLQELLSPTRPPSLTMPKLSDTEIACLRVMHQQYEDGQTAAKFRDNSALAALDEPGHVVHRLSQLWPDNPPCELQTRGSYYIRPGIEDAIARLDNPPLPDKLGDATKRWRASGLSVIVAVVLGIAALLTALLVIANFIEQFL